MLHAEGLVDLVMSGWCHMDVVWTDLVVVWTSWLPHACCPCMHACVHLALQHEHMHDLHTCLVSTFVNKTEGIARKWIKMFQGVGNGCFWLCWIFISGKICMMVAWTYLFHGNYSYIACTCMCGIPVHGTCYFMSNAVIGQIKFKFWRQSCLHSRSQSYQHAEANMQAGLLYNNCIQVHLSVMGPVKYTPNI